MKKIINDVKRVNLTLDHEFYAFIKAKPDADFIRLGTWLKQYLKQNIKKNSSNN